METEVINPEVEFEEKPGMKKEDAVHAEDKISEKSEGAARAELPARTEPLARTEPMKRFTAVKLRIGDITGGVPVIENERFKFLRAMGMEISRVNVVANVIDKYISEGESRFGSLTLDDASGQIRVRAFGDDVERFFSSIMQGDAVIVIGLLRHFNNEVYITPDIIRVLDPAYLLIRKLETERVLDKKEMFELKDRLMEMIKNSDVGFGVEKEAIFKEAGDSEAVQLEIKKLLEEGAIYESRPGVFKYLG